MNDPSDIQKILIVDDELLNVKILEALLKIDYKILTAQSGTKALQLVQYEWPDLVLLDVMMPGLDGYEVIRQLKRDPATADIPVIFVTALAESSNETEGLALGAVDYITKPFGLDIVKARVRTHLALQRKKKELIELHSLRNQLLSVAAHDLHHPLSSIQGMSKALLEFPLDETERTGFIKAIGKASGQMLLLVDDLLDISVIESGALELHPTPTNLAALITERITLISMEAQRKGIEVQSEIKTKELPILLLDGPRIEQAIDNLLTNAVSFSTENTVVQIQAGLGNGVVNITIRDQGPSLATDQEEGLFGNRILWEDKPNPSLRLAIVKRVIEAHDGNITARSEPDQGVVFTISLPLKTVDPET